MKKIAINFITLGLLILFAPEDKEDKLVRVEATRVSMACTYAIVAYTAQPATTPALLERALDEVDRIDALMSHYKKNSPLSRINREASRHEVLVDQELFDFIDQCLEYSRMSDGAFDITVGRLMKVWGFFDGNPRVPSREEVRAAVEETGFRHILLDKSHRTIRFTRPGIELDLGGIAKGYAVDRVIDFLKSHGIARALISAGGSTIYAIGAPPGEESWKVEIKSSKPIALRNRALSVSGAYSKSFESEGIRYGHILDPRTGWPVQGIEGVVVLAASGTEADALDNLLFVIGPNAARVFLKQRRGVDAFFTPSTSRRPNRGQFEEE